MLESQTRSRAAWTLASLDLPPRLVAAARRPQTGSQRLLAANADRLLSALPSQPSSAWRPDEHLPQDVSIDTVIVGAIRLGDRLHDGLDDSDELRVHVDRLRYGVVPTLKRLGVWELKRRLEDVAFCADTPQRYETISQRFAAFRRERSDFVVWAAQQLRARLDHDGMGADVRPVFCGIDGASRRLKALEEHESFARAPLPDFFDLYVIVASDAHYRALAAIHDLAVPVPGTFEDLVAAPRPNGYSGLVTRVSLVPPSSGHGHPEVIRVVIQDALRYEVARRGVTHPICRNRLNKSVDCGGSGIPHSSSAADTRYVDALVQTVEQARASHALLADPNRLQVFTAGGRSKRHNAWSVTQGQTVLDLAYRISTEVGHGVISSTVNGDEVDLDHRLQEGDVVVLTTNGYPAAGSPRTEDDLLKVTTKRARQYLRRLFNRQSDARGRNLLRNYLVPRGMRVARDELDVAANAVLREYEHLLHEPTIESLYRQVGEANDVQLAAGRVGASILQTLSAQGTAAAVYPDSPTTEWRPVATGKIKTSTNRLKLCGRCVPVTADRIVGVELARQITVHKPTCLYARDRSLVPMEWRRVGRTVRSAIALFCEDRPLLVQGICERLWRRGSGLERIEAHADQYGRARVNIEIYSHSALALGDLLEDLRSIRSVRTVRLESTTLSPDDRRRLETGDWQQARRAIQRDAGGDPILIEPPLGADRRRGIITLPYNAQKPTYASSVFFGRESEMAGLLRRPDNAGRLVLVTGPRRIGKTSLALRYVDSLPAASRPHVVRVDLRDCKRASSSRVLGKIASALRRVRPGAPAVRHTDPKETIERVVASSDKRILLVLDEFAAVLESFVAGSLGDDFITWLRTTMDDGDSPLARRLDMIFVAAPECIELLHIGEIAEHLDRLAPVMLGTLDHDSAYEMITQPFSEQGVHFRRSAANEVITITNGHPYFIILFLEAIVTMLNDEPTKWEVTTKDIVKGTDRLLRHPLCFHGAVNEPGGRLEHHRCLFVVAALQRSNEDRVARADIIVEAGLADDVVDDALLRLVDFRLLDKTVSPGDDDRYRFVTPLVRWWVDRVGERGLAASPKLVMS